MPKSFAVPAHDFELRDRALVPVFDFLQDRFDIIGHRMRAQARIGNRNQRGPDSVGKISPSSGRS